MRRHQSGQERGQAIRRSLARRHSSAFAAGVSLVAIGVFATANVCADQPAPAVLHAQSPELPERPADEWFNSPPLKLSALRGRVVVLHFWTFGCINCRHNDAAYKAWFQKYATKGVTM